MATLQETMAGSHGTVRISGTTAIERDFTTIVGKDDAVISELYYASDKSNNIVTALNLSGVTINQFELITCKAGDIFGKIKLASGAVFTQ